MSPQCAKLQEAQISRIRLMALAPTDQSTEDGGGHVSSAQGSCRDPFHARAWLMCSSCRLRLQSSTRLHGDYSWCCIAQGSEQLALLSGPILEKTSCENSHGQATYCAASWETFHPTPICEGAQTGQHLIVL